MSIRPTESMLPPRQTEADRKAVRAFWRGASIFWLVGFVVGRWI